MNTEREKILGRIREGLTLPAPTPGSHGGVSPGGDHLAASRFSEWLPVVGASLEERVLLFQKNARELKADFQLVDSPAALGAALRALAVAEGWRKIASHTGSLTTPAQAALGLPLCAVDAGYDVSEMESCDAGITECDALIAQTGTVVVTSRSAGGRALSVLPPHHVVLARRDQLLPDLPAGFAFLKAKYAKSYPSFISLITGPSRTGDIERILVLGAHGPRKLTILCC